VAHCQWIVAEIERKQKNINPGILIERKTESVAFGCTLAIDESFIWWRISLKGKPNSRLEKKDHLVVQTRWLIKKEGRPIIEGKRISSHTNQLAKSKDLASLKDLC